MKFKKHISLFLAVFLLVSNMGLAFNVHFCKGEVDSVRPVLFDFENNIKEKECCGKKVVEKENCCKDKKIQFQKKSQETIIKVFSFSPYLAVIFSGEWNLNNIFQKTVSEKKSTVAYYCAPNAPPLYKLHQQFIFYG